MNNFFNLLNDSLLDNSVNYLLYNLWNFNYFFNDSWYNYDFLNNFLNFYDFWYFNHFFNYFVNINSNLFNSLNSSWNFDNLFNNYLNWVALSNIVIDRFFNLDNFINLDNFVDMSINFNNLGNFNLLYNNLSDHLRNSNNSLLNKWHLDSFFNNFLDLFD